MENFIPPKKILGTIKVTPKDCADKYYIGEASLAIEQIGDKEMINIWANSYHYELHNEKEVLIGDVGFEIMQPLKEKISTNGIIKIDFPNDINKVENNWEELYYGHYYQWEHLKVANWEITMISIPDEEFFKIDAKGYITDDIRAISDNHFIECTFKSKLESKINSRFNWNYSLNNPNAKNQNLKKKKRSTYKIVYDGHVQQKLFAPHTRNPLSPSIKI